MISLIKARTTKRNPCDIFLDITDEICLRFGFTHREVVIRPDGLEAIIMGVAPGNDGRNKLWYTIIHPSIKNGEVCYWDGPENLLKAGFKKKVA